MWCNNNVTNYNRQKIITLNYIVVLHFLRPENNTIVSQLEVAKRLYMNMHNHNSQLAPESVHLARSPPKARDNLNK
jgi:hypothetical protein